MRGVMYPTINKKAAEKMFNRKASPDTEMAPKAFMKKEMNKVTMGLKNYGKNVAGGAKIVGSALKKGINKVGTVVADDLFGSPARNTAQRAAGKALNAASTRAGAAISPGEMKAFKYGYAKKKK